MGVLFIQNRYVDVEMQSLESYIKFTFEKPER